MAKEQTDARKAYADVAPALAALSDRVLFGAVRSELPQSVTEVDVAAGIADFYECYAIPADNFARMVAFALRQPDDIDVNEILFRPTAQEL